MTSSTNDKPGKPPKVKGEGGGAGAMAKGILIMILLIIGAGAGGYFFGTFQKFAPIENVPPGTPGAQAQSGGLQTSSTSSSGSVQVKKKFWLHSRGYDHVGFAITVLINGKEAGQFYTDNRDVEITNLIHPGENSIQFKAKLLPEGMREHAGDGSYHLDVILYSGNAIGGSDRQELLKYTRKANEFEDHDDTMTFLPLE